jgi:hypothetical protein
VKAVRVEHEPVLDQKLDGVRALGARAPAIAAASRALLDHGDGFLHHLIFLIARQVARDLVIVAVAFDTWPWSRMACTASRKRSATAPQVRKVALMFSSFKIRSSR